MHARTARPRSRQSLFVVVALLMGACGSEASETASGSQASVAIGAVESGCAAAIDVSNLFNNTDRSSMTTDEIRQLANGAASLNDSLDDPPSDITTYVRLVEEVVGNAAEAAEAQDNPTSRQIMLLLDFEMAGHEADFDRLTPQADAFFSSECGAEYTESMSGGTQSSDTSVAMTEPDTVEEPVADDVLPAGEALGTDESETVIAEPDTPETALITEDTSVGANGVYRTIDIEVGEIIRTNLTPEAALNGGSELGGGEIVMVEVRLADSGARVLSVPLSSYAWASSDGTRMAASSAVAATGAEWNGRVDTNEAKRGYFIFPAEIGATDGAYLVVGGGDHVPERIPLGVGAESSVYPVALPSGQTGAGILTNGATTVCEYPSTFEIRNANATLDAQDEIQPIRPAINERFATLDIAITVESVTGNFCHTSRVVSGNLTDIRMQLDNGDIVGPVATNYRAELDITKVVTLSFPVPADTTAFDLIVAGNESVASWTDITLPDA